jgi:AraC-like DNA-binding protein
MRAWTLHGLPELVTELGGDVDALLQQFTISPRQLESEEAMLPSHTFIRLLETCAQELACPNFGLQLGFRLGPAALGPITLMAKHCETGAEAALAIAKYLRLYIPVVDMRMVPLSTFTTRVIFDIQEVRLGPTRQFLEWSMGVTLRNVRLLLGENARPYAVNFSHAAALQLPYYRRFFNAPVYFGAECTSMDIRTSDLEKPLVLNDPALKVVLADYIEQTTTAVDAGFEVQMRATIRSLLPTGRCKLKVIADQYAISLRTLQRQLQADGIRFDELLDQVRRELAMSYLKEASMPLAHIAAMLGYAEQSSLSHACRRWFNASPNAVRKNPDGLI